jgi:hypothetical protein
MDSLAADFSQTSASILYGKDYSSASDLSKKDDILTLTMEHYSTWEYGDNFFFLDIYNLDDGNNFNASPPKVDGTRDFYFEWQPRISIKKFLENIDMISWSIRDYGISTQINVPVVNGESYLLGPYIDFNLSDHDFLQTNYLIKDTRGVDGVSFQLSLVWFARFFDVFVFTGFADFATSEGEKASEDGYLASWAIAQPQLLYDFGSLQIGMEWYYWKNKFGVEGTVDSVFSPIIKWIF